MALRNIVTEGDPILRKNCRPVEAVDDRIRGILEDMLETMREAEGVGIAAPQVGIMRRMFIAEPAQGEVYYMVNPEILDESGSEEGEEGCLSVPGYSGIVKRPTYLKLEALDFDGKKRIVEVHDFAARVMAHEYDHLNGVLYIDKAESIQEVNYDEEESGEA